MREEMESSFRLRSEREIMRRQDEKSSRNMKRIIDKTYHVDSEKLKVCSHVFLVIDQLVKFLSLIF